MQFFRGSQAHLLLEEDALFEFLSDAGIWTLDISRLDELGLSPALLAALGNSHQQMDIHMTMALAFDQPELDAYTCFDGQHLAWRTGKVFAIGDGDYLSKPIQKPLLEKAMDQWMQSPALPSKNQY